MKFNIRVYGIFEHDKHILVAEERRLNIPMIKFPGGGLEFGEGTLAALSREIREEMNLELNEFEHLYTTDFYQESVFNREHQVISIYYKVKNFDPKLIKIGTKRLDELKNDELQVKWIPIDELKALKFNFPIDRYLVEHFLL